MQGVLAGRYRLERQLGQGGMGSVWLAEHLTLRSWVAVKLMDPAIAATPEGAERFRREAQAAASLRSAHVVQVLDYGVDEATPYLVMELMQGESLAGCLEREKRLTPERTVAVITQVARALGRAHAAGIVHRDLKPDNVFLVREDDQELVKVLDFGIAKTPQSKFGGMETKTGVTMGTPYYMSPEQVEGKKAVDYRTDLWAMAVIACECMTGVRPFDGSTFGELLLNICARPIPTPSSQGLLLRGFDEWFAKATNRDLEQRFASAQELASKLKDVVAAAGGAPAFSAPAPTPPTAMMPAPAHPATPPGQGLYVPAATASPAPTPQPMPQGAAPSVSSMSTSQALQGARPGSSALPWILLVVVLLVAAVGATVLLLKTRSSDAVADAAARSAVANAAAAAASHESVPAPPPDASIAAASPKTQPGRKGGSLAALGSETRKETVEAPQSPVPLEAHVASATTPAPANVAPGSAAKSARCFNDPFSGQIRPVGGGKAVEGATFGCKQDPFTGAYKKL